VTVTDYFDFEAQVSRSYLVPLLHRYGALRAAARVLDVGCGYGGALLALTEAVPGLQAEGIDVDASMIALGQERIGAAAKLIQADFFQWDAGTYDLILMRDVLEHIRRPEEALTRALALVAPGGFLYVSFAPFFGPFGGHQHNASGFWSTVPWIQILPNRYLRRLLPVRGNAYKSKDPLEQDLESVLATRLTLRRFRRATKNLGLRVCSQTAYLSRPDYRIKFGLPAVRLPLASLLGDTLATGIEALMQNPGNRGPTAGSLS
jgi:SAM-dependent methyltransferase